MRELYVVCMWASWFVCVDDMKDFEGAGAKTELMRRQSRILPANSKIMQQRRQSLLLKMCELGGVGTLGQRGVDETRGNISDTFTSTSSLKPSSKDWLLSPESPQQD